MRSNRRRYWLIKRFALGLAIAAFVAPVAQARIDEGSSVKANGYQSFVTDFPSSQVNASDYGMPRAMPVDYAVNRGDQIEIVRSQPRSTGDSFVASDYGMPRAMPSDYALASGNQMEVVRGLPRGTSRDKIEFVRTEHRCIAVAREIRYAPQRLVCGAWPAACRGRRKLARRARQHMQGNRSFASWQGPRR